ncbi:MAG TPA: hypothetical protein VK906_17820 [Egicoccus sp.]|nr:hypothetical protein [Egicoccus sp.]HSK25048.1 hypothetical protein [Egicoccus sp.]
MKTSRWMRTGAAVAAGLLVVGVPGTAMAQPAPPDLGGLEDVLDPDQLEDLLGDLDPEQLEELLDALPDGDDDETPELPPELQDVLDQLLAALEEAGFPAPGEDEDGDPDADADEASAPRVGGSAGTPEAGVGGFAAYAEANGTTVCVGLPAALADGLAPVLEGAGIAGSCELGEVTTTGIRIDLARAQAELRRAATDEAVEPTADAFVTNVLLAAEAAEAPGACQGGPMDVALPPGETPVVTLTLLGVECAADDARAFADVQIAGLDIQLGNLIELGLPAEARDGLGQAIDGLNDQLLSELNPALCEATDPALEGLLGGGSLCETDAAGESSFLRLNNPLDADVPLVDLELIAATSEVVHDGETVTATATSTFTGLNALGIACVGGDGTEPYTFTSTATTDGVEASRSATVTDLQLRACPQEQSLLRLIATDGPLGDIAVLERIVQDDLVGGSLAPVFDGVDQLLGALSTQAITQGEAYTGEIDGAGTAAGTTPFVIAASMPMAALPGLADVGGEIAVIVHANETRVGVNATPAGPTVSPDVIDDPGTLPHTGPGLAGVVGLAAMAGAFALRRRED